MNRFSRKTKLTIAKTMIAFSFLLMVLGLYIYLDTENYFIDPIKDTKIITDTVEDDEKVSINTTDEETKTEETPTEEENSSNTTDNSNNTTNNNSASQSTDSNYNQNVVSLDTTNNELRNRIQSTYGITVKYGYETGSYSVGGLNTIQINDANVINQTLNNLNYNLSLYPTNFFKEIKSGGLNLNIYLIKRYSQDNVTGVTDSSNSNVMMSLATDYSFAESLNHELLHYIDAYIMRKGGTYLTWNNLNPQGFSYGNVVEQYSYTRTGSADAYFVNNYAQTDEYEDRASTFEYMMSQNKPSCLNYNKPVWLKARYMSEQIDLFFNSVSPNITEYWERYVY